MQYLFPIFMKNEHFNSLFFTFMVALYIESLFSYLNIFTLLHKCLQPKGQVRRHPSQEKCVYEKDQLSFLRGGPANPFLFMSCIRISEYRRYFFIEMSRETNLEMDILYRKLSKKRVLENRYHTLKGLLRTRERIPEVTSW